MGFRRTFAVMGITLILTAVALPALAGGAEGGSQWTGWLAGVWQQARSLWSAAAEGGGPGPAEPTSSSNPSDADLCKGRELSPDEATGCLEPGG